MTEDDIRGLLQEMRDDPVPPDSLARVRLAVSAHRATRSRLPWFAALAAAAVLAIFVAMFRPVSRHVDRPVAPAVAVHPAPAVTEVKAEPPKLLARKHAVAKKHKAQPSVALEGEPVVVRIETADPDVVILLIGD